MKLSEFLPSGINELHGTSMDNNLIVVFFFCAHEDYALCLPNFHSDL